MIFWQLGLVSTLNVIQLCLNGGAQYLGVVFSTAAANPTGVGPKTLLEPIFGLATSYQFVKAATDFERQQRIATLAAFFATSGAALTTDPTTNDAIGSAVTAKIAYMRAILARGGGHYQIIADSIKTPILGVGLIGFTTLSTLYVFQRVQRNCY